MQTFVAGLAVVVLLAIGAMVAWVYWLEPQQQEPMPVEPNGGPGTTVELSQMLSSAEYDFSLRYPADWRATSTRASGVTPVYNAYLPDGESEPPLTHHSAATHVSVYPNGVPTEGLFAQTAPLSFNPGFALAEGSRMYVLEDGTPFAAYLVPAAPPASWGPAGFVWVAVRVEGMQTRCVDAEGAAVPQMQCDPLASGHQVLWSGSVDLSRWQQATETLRSLTFVAEQQQ